MHESKRILEKAKAFHGHICPFLAIGIKASFIAMEELGISRLNFEESVGESILAIVETNNCFTDGVQIATGCTMGNNSLIYFDLGKNALTLAKRGSWNAVRVYIDSESLDRYFSEEETSLFRKVVIERKGGEEETKRLGELWEKKGYEMLNLAKEEFKVEKFEMEPVEHAPIFKNVRCSACNELAMDTRIVYYDGRPYCLKCAGEKYYTLTGRGIMEVSK